MVMNKSTIKNTSSIFVIILLVWAIFSLIYIGYDVWSDFKSQQINQAYQSGRVNTVNNLINRATKDCKPFTVNSNDKKVDLIRVKCLQQAGQGAQQQGAQQAQPQSPQE